MSNVGMIKPDDVLRHLCNVLPRVTDRFNNTVPVTSAHINADLKLVVTVIKPQLFNVGYTYGMTSLKMVNPIVSCEAMGSGLWQIETEKSNRVSEYSASYGGIKQVEISDWSMCDIVSSQSETKFTIKHQGTEPTAGQLLESLGSELSAIKCEAITGNQVTFGLSEGYWYECDCICDSVVAGLNISIVKDDERAVNVYSSIQENTKDKLWCFLIFGDRATVSKPRNPAGLVMQGQGMSQVDSITVGTDFDLLVFWPRDDGQESARAQINEAYGAIYEAFESVLFGYSGITGYQFAPRASGMAKSATLANYIHQYGYQAINERKTEVHGIKPSLIYWDVPIQAFDVNFLIDAGDVPQEMRLKSKLTKE
jgi:hypothetical protein